MLEGGHLFVEDVEKTDPADNTFAEEEGITSFAALRLKGERWEKPLGVLYLDFRVRRSFTELDRELLALFAEEAFERLEAQWRVARYQQVSRISAEINHDLRSPEGLFATLDDHLGGILDSHSFFSLGTFSWQREEVHLLYRLGDQKPGTVNHPGSGTFAALESKPGALIWSRQEGSPAPSGFDFAPLRLESGFTPRTYLFAPLMVRKVMLGFLCLAHPKPGAFDEEDVRVLDLVAQHASSALNNIRLFLNLRRLAEAGQFLAEPLSEEAALQRVVDEILGATQADVVVLYPYHAQRREFRLPPKFAGDLLGPRFPQPTICREGDPPYRVLAQPAPIYLSNSADFWARTGYDTPPIAKDRFQAREQVASLAALSLRSHGGVSGVLFLNYRRRQPFDAPQRQLIEGLAPFAGAALQNAKTLIQVGARRAEEHTIIQQIDRAIGQATDHRVVLKEILEGANQLLKADAAAILLQGTAEKGKEIYFIAEAIGHRSDQTLGWSTRDAKSSILGWVIENRKTAHIADLPNNPEWSKVSAAYRPETRSELDVPLIASDGEVVGVLNFESQNPDQFTQHDREFLELLAGQVLIAVGRARDTELAQQEAADRKLLADLGHSIIGETNIDRLLPIILERVLETTGATAGVLMIYDEERRDLEARFEKGTPNDNTGMRFSLDQGIIGYVARNQTSLNIDPTEPPWSELHLPYAPDTRSELAVPLLAGNRLRGVLNIESPIPKQFRHRTQRLTEALADLAVIALENAESLRAAQAELARFNVLAEAGEMLGRLSELNQLEAAYRIVLDLAVRQCGGVAVMRRLNSTERKFVLAETSGDPEPGTLFDTVGLEDGLNGRAYANRELQYEPDLHTDRGSPPANPSDPSARSLLVAPVHAGKYYGNIGASHRSPHRFGAADQRMFEGLAQILAITHHRLEVIAEKQELQKAKEQSEILGWMGAASYQIAHRLGNRLGTVASRLNQVQDRLAELGIQDEKVDGFIARIRIQNALVLELGDKMTREVKKLENRSPRAFSLGELVMELANYHDSSSECASVKAVFEGQGPRVFADRENVYDILDNLLQNSVTAIEKGSIRPGLVEIRLQQNLETARIEVSDNGCGIPEKNTPFIFSFLYSTKGGSGFGLWSGSLQARLNDGDLSLTQTEVGVGSTMTLTLPLATEPLGN